MRINLINEWDCNEIKSKVEKENRVLFTAEFPGAGKSYAIKECFSKDSTLFVCPYNKLCWELKNVGFQAITVNKLLGKSIYEGSDKKIKPHNIEAFKTIVFEEIYSNSVSTLVEIERFIRLNNTKQFIANGDSLQLKAVNMDDDEKEYRNKAVMKMFNKNVHLSEVKRVKDIKQIERVKKLKKDFFSDEYKEGKLSLREILKDFKEVQIEDVVGKCLTYTNKTAQIINMTNLQKNGGKYRIGDEMICKCPHIFKEAGNFKTFINYSYFIRKVSKDGFILEEPLEKVKFVVSLKEFYRLFVLAYAQTVHSVQGLTYKEKLTVCDLDYTLETEFLWVAFTRNENLEDISVCFNKNENKIAFLSEKIKGHIDSDKKKGFEWKEEEYVDREWFNKQIKKQHYCCACCHNLLSLNYDDKDEAQYSINRKDNTKPHTMKNCDVFCLSCQRRYNDGHFVSD